MQRYFIPSSRPCQVSQKSLRFRSKGARYLLTSLFGTASVLFGALAGQAAETVTAQYGQFAFDLELSELQAYADSGQTTPVLEPIDILLSDEQRNQVREALTQEIPFPPPVLARFLSTPSGYQVLEELTTVLQAKSASVDSVLALRTAMIVAASEEGSFSLLSLLKSFPDAGVQLDVERGAQIFSQLQAGLQAQQDTIAMIKSRSPQSTPPSKALANEFVQAGPHTWNKTTFNLTDERPIRLQSTGQSRSFPLDLYLPNREGAAPLIILSHGLGSGRAAYQYFAEHLASYGYAVLVPEHPGSSFRQWKALLRTQTNVISRPQEFIDRPLDIQYLLDVIAEKNQSDPQYQARFDLERVGIFGHSYGGYTALVAAGAKIDISSLRQKCTRDMVTVANPSLLLQCQAARLPETLPELSDPRIKAVFLSHPIQSTVLGQQGLASVRVPVAITAGGEDRIAPFVPEQVNPFGQITASPDRTLVLVERADHFSPIGEIPPHETVLELTEEGDPVIAKSRVALKALGLAFFQSRLNPTSNSQMSLLPLVRSLNEPQFPVYGLAGVEDSWAVRNQLQSQSLSKAQ